MSPILAFALALTPLPPGLNEFSRLSGRSGSLANIRRASAAALGRALADGVQLLEVEFPPLLETKTQFDDFSNVEVLDANRDFAIELALEPELRETAPDDSLWLIFADAGEADLAREAWPGKAYRAATQTSIAAAVCLVSTSAVLCAITSSSSFTSTAFAFTSIFALDRSVCIVETSAAAWMSFCRPPSRRLV